MTHTTGIGPDGSEARRPAAMPPPVPPRPAPDPCLERGPRRRLRHRRPARGAALAEIGRSPDFLRAYGLDRSGVGAPPEFFAGHESLLLDYERALTVAEPHPEAGHDVPYATTGHLLWLGESHEPGGDHAGHLSSVHNPVAVRLGPGTCPDTVLAAVDRLDPHRAPERLTLVAAMGADRVRDLLPAVVEKVRAEGASVRWVSDPVRAHTTREEVRDEVRGFIEVHRSSGSHPGGVHVDPAAASGGGPATGGPDRGPALDVSFHFAEACGEPRRAPAGRGAARIPATLPSDPGGDAAEPEGLIDLGELGLGQLSGPLDHVPLRQRREPRAGRHARLREGDPHHSFERQAVGGAHRYLEAESRDVDGDRLDDLHPAELGVRPLRQQHHGPPLAEIGPPDLTTPHRYLQTGREVRSEADPSSPYSRQGDRGQHEAAPHRPPPGERVVAPAGHHGPGHQQPRREAARRIELHLGLLEFELAPGQRIPGLEHRLLGAEQQPVPVHIGTAPGQPGERGRLARPGDGRQDPGGQRQVRFRVDAQGRRDLGPRHGRRPEAGAVGHAAAHAARPGDQAPPAGHERCRRQPERGQGAPCAQPYRGELRPSARRGADDRRRLGGKEPVGSVRRGRQLLERRGTRHPFGKDRLDHAVRSAAGRGRIRRSGERGGRGRHSRGYPIDTSSKRTPSCQVTLGMWRCP
nr:3-deoxy-D-arabinoheptulosonate-7-phosphate synthase [Streptomyces sp. SS]